VAAAALAAAAVVVPLHSGFGERATPSAAAVSGIAWIPFSPVALAAALDDGKTVFVDVTADWCITCKVNKAAVVEHGEVARRLAAGRVVAMRADWTRPDDVITRYLASFGRYGVPFNAVYGPAAKDGIALSELLGEAEILAALDRAGGN
jgi:suppressor for copper-sensitivity B